MPLDSIVFLTLVVVAFLVFMATLAYVSRVARGRDAPASTGH
jgi:hypothetical protein